MSQELLGKMIGATQQTVSRWEQGRGAPRMGLRSALLDVLGPDWDCWPESATATTRSLALHRPR